MNNARPLRTRSRLKLPLGLLSFLPFLVLGALAERPHGKPNVVIFYVDDMGYADPSCFGNPDMETPFIDRFAKEGLKLTNYYTNSPICSPSRVALNTGQAPGRHKVWAHFASKEQNRARNMVDYLDPNVQTMAKSFEANGYATAHFGKWHMGGGRDVVAPLPQAYGFQESLVSMEGLGDRFLWSRKGLNGQSAKLGHGNIEFGEKYETTGKYVDRAIDFMKRNQDKPFYLHVFPNDVHDAHAPKEEWLEKYSEYSNNPFTQKFYAILDNMDRQFGRLVDAVDDLGLGEHTIVVFTSDNGPTDWPLYYKEGFTPPGWTGPFYGRKWSLYEGGIRMPFIVRWTGKVPRNQTDETSIVSAVDLFPSLHAMANAELPRNWKFDGEDLSKVLLGKGGKRSAPVFWEYAGNPGILKPGNPDFESPTNAMRDGDWKLLTNDDGSDTKLFNLKKDIGETTNLATRYPERAERMKQRLLAWRTSL